MPKLSAGSQMFGPSSRAGSCSAAKTWTISAELVDARDDSHIWGQQYTRDAADIFALQKDLAREMTSALRMRLTGDDEKRMAKSYTVNPGGLSGLSEGPLLVEQEQRGGIEQGHRILSAGDC